LEEVAAYWEQVVTLNTWQQHRIAKLVVTRLFGTVSAKRIGLLGFAFKADTNDTRESPAIRICRDLLEEGAVLAIVDPKVSERQMAQDLGQSAGAGEGSWLRVPYVEEAASGADALLLSRSGRRLPRLIGQRLWRLCGGRPGCLMPAPMQMGRRLGRRGCMCGPWGRAEP
jgi:UDPglucose 6-dehydrogenase